MTYRVKWKLGKSWYTTLFGFENAGRLLEALVGYEVQYAKDWNGKYVIRGGKIL